MNHYVYKITDPKTKQFYIGSRSYEGNVEEDDYMGSYKTWNPENQNRLQKQIIKSDFETREDAIEFEAKLIEKHIDNELNENYHIPNKGFHITGNTEIANKISKSHKGKTLTEEHKNKLRMVLSGENHYLYGKKRNKKVIEKIKENHADVSGENHPLYGVTGSLNTNYGKKRTKEQCDNISNGLKGHIVSDETRCKMSLAHKGKKLSEAHKKSISNSNLGKSFTKEHKNKISEARKNWYSANDIDYSGKNNPNAKKVILIKTGKVFNTMKEAANFNNSTVATIRNHCNKKVTNSKFAYLDQLDE